MKCKKIIKRILAITLLFNMMLSNWLPVFQLSLATTTSDDIAVVNENANEITDKICASLNSQNFCVPEINNKNEKYKIYGYYKMSDLTGPKFNRNLYCAEKGAHVSRNGHDVVHRDWDYESGIFRDEPSYQKLTWIINNFWECIGKDTYTIDEKYKILHEENNNITVEDVEKVYANNTDENKETYKLQQMIVWTYTNIYGKDWTDNDLKGLISDSDKSTQKIYETIINMANKYYMNTSEPIITITQNSEITKDENGNYKWGITINNTGIVPISMKILVDEVIVDESKYDYENNVITIREQDINQDHTFRIIVEKPYVKCTANIWKPYGNKVDDRQDVIEVTGERTLIQDSTSSQVKQKLDGKFKLIINKTDEENNPIPGVGFVISGDYQGQVTTAKVDNDAIAVIEESRVINENNKKFEYKIKEISTPENLYVELKDEIGIELTTGIRKDDQGNFYYSIVDAKFGDGKKENKVYLANGKQVTISLNIDEKSVYENGYYTTVVTLNIENKKKNFDLALTKTITKIITETDFNSSKVSRFNTIDVTHLNGIDSTTAGYYLNKTPLEVKKGSIIEYTINVYNEGDIAAKDIEIKDYIPEDLIICNENGDEPKNGKITCYNRSWEIKEDDNGNTFAKTTIEDTLNPWNGLKLNNFSVKICAKIKDNVKFNSLIYNVAEITSAKDIYGNIKTNKNDDRDSTPSTLNGIDIINEYQKNYNLKKENIENETDIDKSKYNYEDDDDFEVIKVSENILDLSLRKSITRVGQNKDNMQDIIYGEDKIDFTVYEKWTEQIDRTPFINLESINYGRENIDSGKYFHKKEKVNVEKGDYVEYSIRVYNEGLDGYCDGYAKEITDYLPNGLKFYAIVDSDGTWNSIENDNTPKTEKNDIYGQYTAEYNEDDNKLVIKYERGKITLKPTGILGKIYSNKAAGISINGFYSQEKSKSPDEDEIEYLSKIENLYLYQEIKVICKVTNDAEEGVVLTNLAEITDYKATKRNGIQVDDIDGVEDKDSSPNIKITANQTDLENKQINLTTYYTDRDVNDSITIFYKGLEDDDDFENIYIQPIEIHKGVKTVENQNSGYDKDEIQTWVINTKIPEEITEYKKFIIRDTIDYEKTNVNEKRIVFQGIDTVNVRIKDGKKLDKGTHYEVSFDDNEKIITITFIDNTFDGRNNLQEFENKEIEITYNTKFALDEKGNIIGLNQSIPNQAYLTVNTTTDEEKDRTVHSEKPEVHTGAVGVFKYVDKNNNKIYDDGEKALEGAKFKIAESEANAEAGIFIKKYNADGTLSNEDYEITTGKDGFAEFIGLEFGEDAYTKAGAQSFIDEKTKGTVYKYGNSESIDWNNIKTKYYIVETYAPEGYIKFNDIIEAEVSMTSFEYKNLETYHEVGNIEVTEEGTYNVNLIKYKAGTTTPVEGVEFTAKAVINGKAEEVIASEESPLVTATAAVAVKNNVEMSEANIGKADVFTLKEIDMGTNTDMYIGIEDDIELTVNKETDRSDVTKKVNKIKSISLKVGETAATKVTDTHYTYTKNDGSKVDVEYDETSKTITIKVTNPVKKGGFVVNLTKTIKGETNSDGTAKPLAGARFKVVINDGTKDIFDSTKTAPAGLATGADGKISTIDGLEITGENLTYSVTVTELSAPEGYIGLKALVTFTAVSKFDEATKTYRLVNKEKQSITNDCSVTVNPGEILIEAENRVEPEIYKGVKTVENQDSGYDKNELQTWVINSTVPAGIGDYTKYVITDTIDPEKTNVAEKRIAFVNEDHPEQNVEVKYKGTDTKLTVNEDYEVEFITDTKILTITFIKGEGANDFKGGKNLREGTTLEITYNTQFTLDDDGNIIGLNQEIPNQAHLTFNGTSDENKENTKDSERPEVHTGAVGVFKYDTKTKKALAGAKFKIAKSEADRDAGIFVKKYNADGTLSNEDYEIVTRADGYAEFIGLEFGEDAYTKAGATLIDNVYKYDTSKISTKYFIVETEVPEDYVLLAKDAIAAVDVNASSFSYVDLTTYHEVGNTPVVYEGEYGVRVIKYGKSVNGTKEAIEGVKFTATRVVNDGSKETLNNITTDSTGAAQIGDVVTIDKNKVSNTDIDVYTIKEESIPETSEYYIGLDKEIKINIHKSSYKSADGATVTNFVKSIEMIIEGEKVTKESDTEYKATITKDEQELELVAKLENNTITLTIENPHKTGKFDLDIIKVVKGTNPKKPLTGAGFKITVKEGDTAVTDKDGNALDGSKEYIVGNDGKLNFTGIDIRKSGLTYNVKIEETTVPAGYIGIAGPIEYSATSTVTVNGLELNKATPTISNDVKVEIKANEIWNEVENKPEPEIHKGIKDIQNQDSGYDKDELQEWVINSTVPAGISDYTKYVLVDEIDPEITNVEDKRIAFVGLDSVHVKIIGQEAELKRDEDYVAAFDDENKVLKIMFIEGGFKEGQKLPENSTIEVKFNTKFVLNDDGTIKGLDQSIPNQAKLEFNGNGKEDIEKYSERPEVHTGAVGVFKYEDENENGKYDEGEKALVGAHFKIAKSKEDAKNKIFLKDGNDKDIEVITDDEGKGVFEGLEFGEDALKDNAIVTEDPITHAKVYTYDWEKVETAYYIVETETPKGYVPMDRIIEVTVKAHNFNMVDLTTYYHVGNIKKIYDLALRKFITAVNDKEITDRIPKVTLTDEFKDKNNKDVTTAKYEHSKDPVIVQNGNIVTYTIRVYNEGPNDAYASLVKDDIPSGVQFIGYTDGDGSVNDKYRWKLVDENDNEVKEASKAKYIVTDYLAKENGKEDSNGVNNNLLKAFDSDKINELDYRDVKVQFLVTEPNTSDKVLVNYAQISETTDTDGEKVIDRDSTPNKWVDGEDDQDIENIKLLYFDLALRKWVTKAIVTENGQTVVTETGHHAEDDPEDVVKVDLKKSKVDSVVVKFEYQIRVTNEGNIGGYADEITDHIPDGLKFDQADNKIWTVVDDKTITTDVLKDVYLEPGESTEVTVVLTWINNKSNLGIKTNIAEISKDRNKYKIPDIDSIPGNYKYGEDDIDDAPVMLSIKTGNDAIIYAIIGILFVTTIAVGAILVKNYSKKL